ncbi:MAG TPA: PhnD/SsuA/transferrin family substrate-binding protein [Sphingobium sp.]|uniref:phosphate/phosphite/phosphonate ABC transporter substrate-binding protein n=1 Tax=Sphingobium sp. TaxID=1912891 RepID=UPI002ED1F1E5
MIASLPMYDLPWLRSANDRLWSRLAQGLRDRGIQDVPATLHRGGDLEDDWTSPSLLLGQTCGYPLVTQLRETVQLVATPHYDAEGCEGPFHRAAIVVRRDDPARSLHGLRGKRAGVNGAHSNSGMNLFRAAIAAIADGPQFFGSVTITGSHVRSVSAILSGRVDVASIDAVTLALLRDRYPRHADEIRVLDWTAASPSLPLITSAHSPHAIVTALRDELEDLPGDPDARATFGPQRITGFSTLQLADYRPILAIEQQAIERGYPVLR